ncbi:hypothetical protein CPB84DRAFT_1678562, partial [Gymnopilus junonius]
TQEYHTSKLTGEEWVNELIHSHPDCIWVEEEVNKGGLFSRGADGIPSCHSSRLKGGKGRLT